MMTPTPTDDPAAFYRSTFTRGELADLDRALGDSLRGEIGMLRMVMRRFFERVGQETDDIKALADALRVLGLSVTRLARVVQTERQLQDTRADDLGEALTRSMAAVLDELREATGPERGSHGR
jgi:galactokinase